MTSKQKKYFIKTSVSLMFVVAILFMIIPLIPSSHVSAAGNGVTEISKQIHLDNPLGSGTNDFLAFVKKILKAIVLLLTPFLVIMLVYAGFLFVTARGSVEKLGEAKQALMWTLIGAAIVIGAESFATLIGNTVNCVTTGVGTGC